MQEQEPSRAGSCKGRLHAQDSGARLFQKSQEGPIASPFWMVGSMSKNQRRPTKWSQLELTSPEFWYTAGHSVPLK